MPYFFDENKYLNINWDLFFQDIDSHDIISSHLKNNIKKADFKVKQEFYQYLIKDIELFTLGLPFYSKNKGTAILNVHFNIPNIIHFLNNEIDKEIIKYPLQYIEQNSDILNEISTPLTQNPIIIWKNNDYSIILDGNHRAQYAKKEQFDYINSYILKSNDLIYQNFFCDSLSYYLFTLWCLLYDS